MSNVYEVQEILDEAVINNQPHYLIKWKNHTHEDDTWEALSDLANISQYLQHWLRKRRQSSESRKKENKQAAYHTIKPYLYRENLKPPKKSTRQKYAEEILKKKKTWQKYIDKEPKCIEIDTMDVEVSENQKVTQRNDPKCKGGSTMCKMQQREANSQRTKSRQQFKVVGKIDTDEISKIVRTFTWKDVVCVQVELNNGRRFNMKEEELKKYQPLLLVEFYQSQQIPF